MHNKDVSSAEFITEVAKDVFNNFLADEDKEYMREHDPDAMQRFMLGMGIRNSCIYPYLRMHKFTDGDKHPDDVSDEVIDMLIRMARDGEKKKDKKEDF